jgi:multidrug efflux pump subunit AcrA (membrane-fusion protein)
VSEFGRNVDSPDKTSRLVIAGRLILLLLAGIGTVWAFAFSGGSDHAPIDSGEHAHVHGAGVQGTAEHDHAIGGEPAASPVFTVAQPAGARVIGTAEARTFSLSVRAAAWLESNGRVTAVLRNDELGGLSPGEHAFFFRASAPAEGIDVRLTAEPPVAWDGSTSRVRFRFAAPASGPAPGEVGWVELAARPRVLLVIPASAVLYSPEGPYVLAAGADGLTFSTRRVQIGTVSRSLAVVLSGLREGEPIVVGSTFSWDAERRLQAQRQAAAGAMQ